MIQWNMIGCACEGERRTHLPEQPQNTSRDVYGEWPKAMVVVFFKERHYIVVCRCANGKIKQVGKGGYRAPHHVQSVFTDLLILGGLGGLKPACILMGKRLCNY